MACPDELVWTERALQAARRRKERRYPELARRFGRAKLVVLAVEVGGRWSKETVFPELIGPREGTFRNVTDEEAR